MLLAILACVLLVGAPEAHASKVKHLRGFIDRFVPVPPPGANPHDPAFHPRHLPFIQYFVKLLGIMWRRAVQQRRRRCVGA